MAQFLGMRSLGTKRLRGDVTAEAGRSGLEVERVYDLTYIDYIIYNLS